MFQFSWLRINFGIPTVLHESNAFPGASVKFLSKKTGLILAGFEDTKMRLPKAKKVVVTGTPTKIKDLKLDNNQKEEIRKNLGLQEGLPVVLVFGGSQGAKSINESLIEMIKNKLNKNYQIMWASGPKQYDQIKEALSESKISTGKMENVKIVPYIYNMEEVMNVSDIVVARSGAMTITEISKLGKPAIFIPLPYATENHQEYNAKVLENIGAAKIVLDKDLNGQILNNTIEEMVKNKETLLKMGEMAKQIEVKNVEDTILEECKKLISK